MQGVSGKHIRYDSRSESYIIDPALQLNSTVRDTALCLCELGWLYNRVMDYVNKVSAAGVAVEHRGLVIQAFSFALQVDRPDCVQITLSP